MIYLACAVLLSPSDRRCCRGCCKPATAKDRGGLFVWILLQLIGYMLAAAVLGCRWTQSVTTGAKKGVNQEVGQTVCWGLSAAQRRAQSDVGGWLFFIISYIFLRGDWRCRLICLCSLMLVPVTHRSEEIVCRPSRGRVKVRRKWHRWHLLLNQQLFKWPRRAEMIRRRARSRCLAGKPADAKAHSARC